MESLVKNLVGKTYEFEDGVAKLYIFQVKMREASYWVMYEVQYGGALPKRLVSKEKDFIEQFGHLFGGIRNEQ